MHGHCQDSSIIQPKRNDTYVVHVVLNFPQDLSTTKSARIDNCGADILVSMHQVLINVLLDLPAMGTD